MLVGDGLIVEVEALRLRLRQLPSRASRSLPRTLQRLRKVPTTQAPASWRRWAGVLDA